MKPVVAVVGLWHLGCTIAACMAAAGFRVIATDPDRDTVRRLGEGKPPVEEPGLADLVRDGLTSGRLSCEPDGPAAVGAADVLWVAFDTPVDDEDTADVEWVRRGIAQVMPALRANATVLISSQVPIGFTREQSGRWRASGPAGRTCFAYVPENLRLGKAVESFRKPVRTILGTEDGAPNEALRALFAPFGGDIFWMSLESAEMTKHALNAFLATSVSFINEVARLCEHYGADAKDVERGLKSEPRIGPAAYLSPGPAFAGGTLARDVGFLSRLAATARISTPLLSAVIASNAEHALWLRRKLQDMVGDLAGARVAVLGLAYKPGTDTLRRSSSLALCEWLAEQGALVRVHDPAVGALPSGLRSGIERVSSALEACRGAEATVVATPWPEYRGLVADAVVAVMKTPRVIDQFRFLADTLGADRRVLYATVGTPVSPWRGRDREAP